MFTCNVTFAFSSVFSVLRIDKTMSFANEQFILLFA